MTDPKISAFANAVHSGDPERVRASLADDVVMNSPILSTPLTGADTVTRVLGLLSQMIDDLTVGEILSGEQHHAVHLSGNVGSVVIEAFDYLHLDATGLVDTITVLGRPVAGLVALQNRLAPTIGMAPMSLTS
jgi:hypothetical protein